MAYLWMRSIWEDINSLRIQKVQEGLITLPLKEAVSQTCKKCWAKISINDSIREGLEVQEIWVQEVWVQEVIVEMEVMGDLEVEVFLLIITLVQEVISMSAVITRISTLPQDHTPQPTLVPIFISLAILLPSIKREVLGRASTALMTLTTIPRCRLTLLFSTRILSMIRTLMNFARDYERAYDR